MADAPMTLEAAKLLLANRAARTKRARDRRKVKLTSARDIVAAHEAKQAKAPKA